MTSDRPLLGIALMLGFCLLAPVADALAKLLAPHLGVTQIVALRFGFQAAILLPIVAATGRRWRMPPGLLGLVALRTALHVLGIAAMIAALRHLPLADAIAIAYVMPFILLLLGHWLLGEQVGWRRIAACLAGFAGTLMVIQPAFDSVGWPALLPLLVAVAFAAFMLVTRHVAPRTDPLGMQAVSAVMALAALAPVLLLAPDRAVHLAWTPPAPQLWSLIAAMGLAGTLGHLLLTWSLGFAPASTLAPIQYLEIPAATLVGYLVFADLPGPLAGFGIAVPVTAGLYVVMCERAILHARTRDRAATLPGTPPAG